MNDLKLTEEQNIILEKNYGLIVYTANMFNNGNDIDDLIQIASIGMVKAIKSFDVHNGTNFSNYAIKVMTNFIRTYLKKYNKLKNNLEIISLNDEIIIDNTNITNIKNDIYNTLEKFNGLKYKIIKYFINDSLLNIEIAKKCKCSPSYVCDVIKQYRYLLKKELEII